MDDQTLLSYVAFCSNLFLHLFCRPVSMLNATRTTPEDKNFQKLVSLLDQDLLNRYGAAQEYFSPHNKIDPSARAVIVYAGKQPVGCGCYRPMAEPGKAEIKRMFVLPEWRGRGVAKTILHELEIWAASEGYQEAVLETGNGQPEAISLYGRCGYGIISSFGPYVGLEESICFGKQLN
jgi:GNAT superfamily N-acetyltransferase